MVTMNISVQVQLLWYSVSTLGTLYLGPRAAYSSGSRLGKVHVFTI